MGSVHFSDCLKPTNSNMKFLVLAALLAVVAADSAYPAPAYPKASYPAAGYNHKSYDYEARPYEFAYAVKDDYYNDYSHQESSDGNGYVSGSYQVLLPDGRVQYVNYKADDYTGYVADVTYSGEAKAYDYKPAYKAAAYPAPAYKAAAYPAPAYKAAAYPAAAYPTPAYKAETYPAPAYTTPAY